jgi:hypothetical protein
METSTLFAMSFSGPNFDFSQMAYGDYLNWEAQNAYIYMNNLAYQDLNNQNYLASFVIDHTEQEESSLEPKQMTTETKQMTTEPKQMTTEPNLEQASQEKMILEEEEEMPSEVLRPDSPTQARDFKLFCEGCRRCFTSKKRLQNHLLKCLRILGKGNPFSCGQCAKTFKKSSGLSKHELKYHNVIVQEDMNNNNQEALPAKRSIFHSVSLLAVSDS